MNNKMRADIVFNDFLTDEEIFNVNITSKEKICRQIYNPSYDEIGIV